MYIWLFIELSETSWLVGLGINYSNTDSTCLYNFTFLGLHNSFLLLFAGMLSFLLLNPVCQCDRSDKVGGSKFCLYVFLPCAEGSNNELKQAPIA